MSTHDNGQCCAIVFGIVYVLSFILFMTSFVMPYSNRDRYSEELCMVNIITTPESLLNSSDNLWTGCDCGRRCTGETACTKITVDILGGKDDVLLNTHIVSWLSDGDSNTCTYKNSKCGRRRAATTETNVRFFLPSHSDHRPFQCDIRRFYRYPTVFFCARAGVL